MKFLKFFLIGILFGIVMTKSEAISWYRIQEMFRFQSFHMYGIIGAALLCGLAIIQIIKGKQVKTIDGEAIELKDKAFSIPRYLFGGIIFGLGWALSGACPGPLYTLVGAGFYSFIVVILGALVGTLCYGAVRKYLPH